MEDHDYYLKFNDPIDGICSNSKFDVFATIQRRRELNRYNHLSVTSLIRIINNELTVVKSFTHRIGRQIQNSPSSIAWSHLKENIVICTTPSGNALVWDVSHKSQVRDVFTCGSSYAKAKFHYFDENIMGIGSFDSSFSLYDLRATSNPIHSLGVAGIRDFDFAKHIDTKNIVVTVGEGGLAKFYDLRKPHRPFRELLVHQGQIMSVLFSKTEKNVISTGGQDKFIKMLDWSKDGDTIYSIETPSSIGKIAWTNINEWQICNIPTIATSEDIGDFSTYIWDFRKPYLPFKCSKKHTDFITDIVFPLDSSNGRFCTTDVSGNIMIQTYKNLDTPIKNVDLFDVAASNVENECILSKPSINTSFNKGYYNDSDIFPNQIKSSIYISKIGEENCDSNKFKYLARKYKLFSTKNETVLDLCKYNSKVAFSIGDIGLSRSWDVLGIAANNDPIASIRTSLGQQARSSNNLVHSSNKFYNVAPESFPEEDENSNEINKEELIDLCDPSMEFCFDQELLDFCGILEEEQDFHYPDEMIFGKIMRIKRKKFRPKLQIPNREEWYTGSSIVSPELSPLVRKASQKRFHRYYSYHHKFPSVSFKNTPKGEIRRTLASSVFDITTLSKDLPDTKKNNYHTMNKIKETYQQKMANRKHEIAAAIKRKMRKKLTTEEQSVVRRKRAQRKIREINLRWIESNRILQSTRTPLNKLQRLIINKSTQYYERKVFNESTIYKRNESLKKITGFKSDSTPDSWNTIKFIFDCYMALDDLQTCACMAMCIGEKITMLLPEESVDRWFYYYVHMLEEYSLFKEATAFIKASFRVTVYQMNCEDNFVNSLCVECGSQLFKPMCTHCSMEQFCLICEGLVHGHWLACTDCGHGGHPEHILEWFKENDKCPGINCDHNCFPKLGKKYVDSKVEQFLNIPNNHKRHFNRNQINFWTHKIPPQCI